MNDIFFITYFFAMFSGIGYGVHRLFRLPAKNSFVIIPILGAAVAVPFSTIAYVHGLSLAWVFKILSALAIILIAVFFYSKRRRIFSTDFRLLRSRALVVGLWVVVTGLLIAPRLTGGMQFAVYQANRWDTFSYMESALSFARYSFDLVTASGVPNYLVDPILIQGHNTIFNRPTIHIFYGVCSQFDPSHLWNLHYAFIAMFMSLTVLAVTACLSALFRVSTLKAMVVASTFAMGFWGQYVVDINAWSQLCSGPFLVMLIGTLISTFSSGQKSILKTIPVIALISSAAVYAYPEAFFVFAFGLGSAISIVYFFHRKQNVRFLPLLIGGAVGVLSTVFYFKGTLGYAYHQYFLSGNQSIDWWKEYQAFFTGRDGLEVGKAIFHIPVNQLLSQMPFSSIFYELIDIASGFAGLYFLTPLTDDSAIWRLMVRLFLLVLIVALGWTSWKTLKGFAEKNTRSRINVLGIALFLFVELCVMLSLVSRGAYWSAGKLLSYCSPIFVSLLVVAFMIRGGRPRFVIPAIVYIVIAFGSGVFRVSAAANNQGIHYARPYPVADNEIKINQNWNLERFDGKISSCKFVKIQVQDPWIEHYMMMYLTSNNKAFTSSGDVRAYFSEGVPMGKMPAENPVDCIWTESKVISGSELPAANSPIRP